MSSVVQNMLDGVLGDGARSTKFECFINFGETKLIDKENDIFALVKTSQFPGKSHDVIDLKFKGRNIPVKGQVKYENTWTCTFMATESHELKKAFEDWIESLDQKHNINAVSKEIDFAQKKNNVFEGSGYTNTLRIAQMDFHGENETIVYELYNAFPKSVSSIPVDYSSVGTILEFTVEFSYSHYDSIIANVNKSFVDDFKDSAINTTTSITNGLKGQIAGMFNNMTGSSKNNSNVGSINSVVAGKSDMTTQREW